MCRFLGNGAPSYLPLCFLLSTGLVPLRQATLSMRASTCLFAFQGLLFAIELNR